MNTGLRGELKYAGTCIHYFQCSSIPTDRSIKLPLFCFSICSCSKAHFTDSPDTDGHHAISYELTKYHLQIYLNSHHAAIVPLEANIRIISPHPCIQIVPLILPLGAFRREAWTRYG